jgi:hypothetical protein
MSQIGRGAFLLAAALAGCSAFSPYATFPEEAKKGEPQGERVAICYNFLASAKGEVEKAAQQQCPEGTVAARVATDWRLDYCPLLLPARANFACIAKK